MKLPAGAVIAGEKLTEYLLRKLPENDKSGYLALAGYALANSSRLEADIRNLLLTREAEFAQKTEYGDIYRITGELSVRTAGFCE